MPYRTQECCPQGHTYDEANTIHNCGKRYCRTCQLAKSRRVHAERYARLKTYREALARAARAAGLSSIRWQARIMAAVIGVADPYPSPRPNGKPRGTRQRVRS